MTKTKAEELWDWCLTEVMKLPNGNYVWKQITRVHEFAKKEQREDGGKATGETSDGYHTFNELYDFRKEFNALLFNEWFNQGKYQVHKSKRHSNGEECFGGRWFIVMATLPTGQISNHYELKDWNLFQCEERKYADLWDGHTTKDVLERLKALSSVQVEHFWKRVRLLTRSCHRKGKPMTAPKDQWKEKTIEECLEDLEKWAYEKFVVKYGDEIMTGKPFYLELKSKLYQISQSLIKLKDGKH